MPCEHAFNQTIDYIKDGPKSDSACNLTGELYENFPVDVFNMTGVRNGFMSVSG